MSSSSNSHTLRFSNNKIPLIDHIVCTDYDKLHQELKIEFYERIIIKNYDFINNVIIYDKSNLLAQTITEHTVKIDESNKFILIMSKEKNKKEIG